MALELESKPKEIGPYGLKRDSIWYGALRYRMGAMLGYPVRFELPPDSENDCVYVYIGDNNRGRELIRAIHTADSSTLSMLIRDVEDGKCKNIEALLEGRENDFYAEHSEVHHPIKAEIDQTALERFYMTAFENRLEINRERELMGGRLLREVSPLRYDALRDAGKRPFNLEEMSGLYFNLLKDSILTLTQTI